MIIPIWTHLTIISIAWLAISTAPAFQKAFEDRDKPASEHRGTSIFPVFPLMPSVFYGVVHFFGEESIAALVITILHLILMFYAAFEIVRWNIKLRKSKKSIN